MTTPSLTVDALERWTSFGAHWCVIALSDDLAVIDFHGCTGELVERRESDDPVLIAYVRSVDGQPDGR